MAETNPELTADFIESLDWESAIAQSAGNKCHNFTRQLFRCAQKFAERHELAGRDAFLLLGQCAGLELVPSDPQEPFTPLIVSTGNRDWNLDAVDRTTGILLARVAAKTKNPEMRARLADIAWITARDFKSAHLAVEAYLASSARHDEAGSWLESRDRLERALRLSATLGRGGSALRRQVLDRINADIRSIDPSDRQRDLQPARLMDLLLEFQAGDAARQFTLAVTCAKRGEAQRSLGWVMAQDYWRLAARWAELSENYDGAHTARLRAAECYVAIAQEFLTAKHSDHLSASIQFQKAVEAFRQIGEATRAEEVHRQLLEQQERSIHQMQQSQHEFDIADMVNGSMDAVKNKEFTQALVTLAVMVPTPTMEQLRESVEQQNDDSLFADLVASQEVVNVRGRVVGKHPSSDPDDAEANLEASMFERAVLFRHLIVAGYIDPAVHQINLEHRPRLADLLSLVQYNPFVPPGRETIFARGLLAGLEDDFLVASHLLVPQVENSLRTLLERRGVIASKLTSSGIQEDYNLTKVLSHPETQAILGKDLWFDLRGLLTESLGSNWRNVTSHGLVEEYEFYGSPSKYTWWLTLRLCIVPLLRPQQPA